MTLRGSLGDGEPAAELPEDAAALIAAIAAAEGVTAAEIIAGACGHALALVPNVAAERVAMVEAAAGLPAGTIAAGLFCGVVEKWIQGDPGALARWVEECFEFHGGLEEKASIGRALYRLEAGWRCEDL